MKRQLIITDLNLLKITKVKPWAIYFNYEKEKYLLHGTGECGEYKITLYKRILKDKGKYELNFVFGQWTDTDYVKDEFLSPNETNKQKLVYSQIDKENFVKKLTQRGYCEGIFKKDAIQINYEKAEIQRQINVYQMRIIELNQKMRELY